MEEFIPGGHEVHELERTGIAQTVWEALVRAGLDIEDRSHNYGIHRSEQFFRGKLKVPESLAGVE